MLDSAAKTLFGPKWDDNGEWRKLHNEELDSFTVLLI